MMPAIGFAIGTVALYGLFLVWYGGHGKPLTAAETERFMTALSAHAHSDADHAMLTHLGALAARDDGREFVMQNLVQYRAKAAYPPGTAFGDDPRQADQRYAKAVLWPLLRHGCLLLFVARRAGSFVEPEGADPWHYVAMVRYRSLRDFFRFAVMIENADIVVHKWAAIHKTHVFPVRPLLSLFFVRAAVGTVLALCAAFLFALIH